MKKYEMIVYLFSIVALTFVGILVVNKTTISHNPKTDRMELMRQEQFERTKSYEEAKIKAEQEQSAFNAWLYLKTR